MPLSIPPWLVASLSAFAAAILGAVLALRQGQEQHIWTARYEAYRDIISAVHDIYIWAESIYSDEKMLPSPGEPAGAPLHVRFKEAKYRLSAYSYAGHLLLSPKAQSVTETFLIDLGREQFRAENDPASRVRGPNSELSEHSEVISKRAQAFLDAFSTIARKDLLPFWRLRLA
jgi:hypothetical protein